MRRLVVLRPEPGASATVERARRHGLEAVALPLFEVEPLDWSPLDAKQFDAILLSSANAVRHGGEKLRQLTALPAYAVGQATADAAQAAGFNIAVTGDADIERLLQSIGPDVKLLHLCGEDRREVAARQEITAIPVYRSKANEGIDVSAANGAVVLIHSPRAGSRFAELATSRSSISIAAISAAAAQAAGDGWESVESAEAPNDDALLALAARLCNISAAQ